MTTTATTLRSPATSRGGGWLRAGVAVLTVLVAVAVAAPLLAPYAPNARPGVPFSPPSVAHLLGTNDIGDDLLSLLIYGARTSLLVGAIAAVAATAIGTLVGLVAGLVRGWVDAVAMRLVDVTLSLPFLPLMIVVGAFLGPGLATQILVITAVMWAGPARELRAQILSLRERDHVQAAQSMGAAPGYVVVRHLLPGVASLVVPQFVLAAKRAVMFEAALSFLGIGAGGAVSWGTMLFSAHRRSAFLTDAWLWWVLPPGLAIAATVIGLALVGYGIEQRLRPQTTALPRVPGAVRRRSISHPPIASPRAGNAHVRPRPGVGVLTVEGLEVTYGTGASAVGALAGVSLHIDGGERVGVVGASGSGKSTLVLAAMGLLAAPAVIAGGRVLIDGVDLAERSAEERRRLLGPRMALVPQQAAAALNPVLEIGDQIAEAVRLHHRVDRAQARRRAVDVLEQVGLDAGHAADYPHRLSGGMRQRAVLAVALVNHPALLVLDEPTTGLDVVTQVELLALLDQVCAEHGMALLTVSHDLTAIAALSDRVAVMDAGRIVEEGATAQVLHAPADERTRALLDAVPPFRRPVADPPRPHLTSTKETAP
jgi:ABC-type dipeptide/oligopeptide/nickel transport system ATPase component/ABC-type dipeptide/oligopeptide/nickel transport system permease subunit